MGTVTTHKPTPDALLDVAKKGKELEIPSSAIAVVVLGIVAVWIWSTGPGPWFREAATAEKRKNELVEDRLANGDVSKIVLDPSGRVVSVTITPRGP